MPPRRSHHKSRNGCITCKKRRVKCDEGGPPCANCKARDTECEYASPVPVPHENPSTGKAHGPSEIRVTSSRRISPAERRLIELQLLHRWSTTAYLSCSTKLCDDFDIWQKTVPEVALQNDFLMETIFALTAFEMAHSFPLESSRWSSLALEYQGVAFHRFRDALQSSSSAGAPDNHDALLYCSILLFVLALATATAPTPYDSESAIDHTFAVHELVRGTTLVMYQKPDCLTTHPLWRKTPRLTDLVKSDLTPDTADTLARMEELNEGRSSPEQELTTAYTSCKMAIKCLKFLFQTGTDKELCSYSLAWLTMCGQDFVDTLKNGDTVALLALMCWGVLLDPFGADYWFADGFGRRLVIEVAEMFQQADEPVLLAQDVIRWATAAVASRSSACVKRDSPRDSAVDGCESSLADVSLV